MTDKTIMIAIICIVFYLLFLTVLTILLRIELTNNIQRITDYITMEINIRKSNSKRIIELEKQLSDVQRATGNINRKLNMYDNNNPRHAYKPKHINRNPGTEKKQ